MGGNKRTFLRSRRSSTNTMHQRQALTLFAFITLLVRIFTIRSIRTPYKQKTWFFSRFFSIIKVFVQCQTILQSLGCTVLLQFVGQLNIPLYESIQSRFIDCFTKFNFTSGGNLTVGLFCTTYDGPHGTLEAFLRCIAPEIGVSNTAPINQILGQLLQTLSIPLSGSLTLMEQLCFGCKDQLINV